MLLHRSSRFRPRIGHLQHSQISDRCRLFLEHECDLLQYTGEVQSFLPLGIEVISYLFSEARWVETSLGTAYVQRRWLTEPPDVSVDWVNVESEYGVIITLPQPTENENVASNVKRIESLWINMSIDGLTNSRRFGR